MKQNLQRVSVIVFILLCIIAFQKMGVKITHAADVAGTIDSAAGSKVSPEYTLLEPLPCVNSSDPKNPSCTGVKKTIKVEEYVNYVFRLAIALAAFLAVFMFTVGGFQYMMSEAVGGKAEAKTRMTNAILGLLAAITSYVILHTIDPRLVQINANVPAIQVSHEDVFADLDRGLAAYNKELDDWRKDARAVNHEATILYAKAQEIRDKATEIDNILADDALWGELSDAEYEALIKQKAAYLDEANKIDNEGVLRQRSKAMGKEVLDVLKDDSTNITELQKVRDKINTTDYMNANGHLENQASSTEMLNTIFLPEKKYQVNVLDNQMDFARAYQANSLSNVASFEARREKSITDITTRTQTLIAGTTDVTLKQRYQVDMDKQVAAIKALRYTEQESYTPMAN